jgi:DeoR/GlpR family transcriptional regulator of sugar metabolism
MYKDKKVKENRAAYVQQVVNKSKDTIKAIKKLSNELFLSEKTIERDLRK